MTMDRSRSYLLPHMDIVYFYCIAEFSIGGFFSIGSKDVKHIVLRRILLILSCVVYIMYVVRIYTR